MTHVAVFTANLGLDLSFNLPISIFVLMNEIPLLSQLTALSLAARFQLR